MTGRSTPPGRPREPDCKGRGTDISIHVRPRDTEATLDALENRIESLEADADYLAEKRRAGVRGVEKDLQDYQALYDSLRNTSTGVFETSMFLTSHVDEGRRADGPSATDESDTHQTAVVTDGSGHLR